MATSVIHDDTAIRVTADSKSPVDRNPRGVQRPNRDPIDNGRLKPNFHGKKGRPNHNGDEKSDGRQFPKIRQYRPKAGSKHDGSFHKLLVQKANGELESASTNDTSIHNPAQVVKPKNPNPTGITIDKEIEQYPNLLNVDNKRLVVNEWMMIPHYSLIQRGWDSWLALILQVHWIFIYVLCGQWHLLKSMWPQTLCIIGQVRVPIDLITQLNLWWLPKKPEDYTHTNFLESMKYAQYVLDPVLNIDSIVLVKIIEASCKYCYPKAFERSEEYKVYANESINKTKPSWSWGSFVKQLFVFYFVVPFLIGLLSVILPHLFTAIIQARTLINNAPSTHNYRVFFDDMDEILDNVVETILRWF